MRRALLTSIQCAVLLGAACAAHATSPARQPDATVDLTTETGAALMHATWRYSDARVIDLMQRLMPAGYQWVTKAMWRRNAR